MRNVREVNRAAKLGGLNIERQLKPCRELHRAQHPQAVFDECARVNSLQQAILQIPAAADWIDRIIRQRIVKNRVDCEVAPTRGIFEGHRRIALDQKASMTLARFRLASWNRNVDLNAIQIT